MSLRCFSVYDIFVRNARDRSSETALADGNRRIDFAELKARTDRLAAGFASMGVGKGDRVAVLAQNDARFFDIFGASAARGAIAVPVNWRLSTNEIRYILKDSEAEMLIVDADLAEGVTGPEEIFSKERTLSLQPGVSGVSSLDDLYKDETVFPLEVETDDPFCLIYTAAVGGVPRGAVLSHGNIIHANIQTAQATGLCAGDVYANMLPLFHITGLNLSMAVMHVGGRNVMMKKFDAGETLRLTAAESVTLWGTFPPMLTRLLEGMKAEGNDIGSLRHVLGLEGPDNIAVLEKETRAKFWMLYGQTETSGMATLSPASEKPGSAGRAGCYTDIQIVDAKDRRVPVGETGEIVVRGPLVFHGFFKRKGETDALFEHEVHHTGDLGALDADGYLWFKGRKPEKELIKPGGENVYPAEVEDVIRSHRAVEAVSVIGVPDPQFGEGVKAVIQLKPGETATEKEIADFVAERIARYKKPRYVEFVDALPKTDDGVIDRTEVKNRWGG